MRILSAVKGHLLADSGVAAIAGVRVYKRRVPQRAGKPTGSGFPRIVLSLASVEFPTRSQARRSEDVQHVVKARVQVDCYSDDEDDVDALAEAVSESFDDFIGTTQAVVIKRSLQDDERDNYEPMQDGSDKGIYRITQDYGIHYVEPTT